jgi:trehalose 6-phosphate synthase/phosphatase
VVWHYRQCEPVYAKWKANQLVHDLYAMLGNSPVEIHHGKRIVEVSSIHINKGRAVEHFINQHNYDRIICAGDDQTDETMFRVESDALISIKIGEGDSLAQHRIAGVIPFLNLLQNISNLTPHPEQEQEQDQLPQQLAG